MKNEALSNHLKVVHIREKSKYLFNMCGKTYETSNSYRNHYTSECIPNVDYQLIKTPEEMQYFRKSTKTITISSAEGVSQEEGISEVNL